MIKDNKTIVYPNLDSGKYVYAYMKYVYTYSSMRTQPLIQIRKKLHF